MCIFKVTGYTFRESNSVIFIFASLLNRGLLLKIRICSCRSKFFPLRVDLFSEGFFRSGKQRGTHSCFPWIKMAEKPGGVFIYLNYSEFLFACIINWEILCHQRNGFGLPYFFGCKTEFFFLPKQSKIF